MNETVALELTAEAVTQALNEAFDIVRKDPTRRKATFTGLIAYRNLEALVSPSTDGTIECLCLVSRFTCTRDERQIQAMREHVLAMWANNLISEHATVLQTVIIRCFPDNFDDYLAVELDWTTPFAAEQR